MFSRLAPTLGLLALLASALLLGCGGEAPEPPPVAGADAPGAPALLKGKLEPGEFRVAGEASPRTQGPFQFDGRYRVRFAQYAPESPQRGFTNQIPLVVQLRPAAKLRARPIPLFHASAKSGQRTISLSGEYVVEVIFGDFPYAIVFSLDR